LDIEPFQTYCLQKKGVTESSPFDQETLVFKVMGKIFALTNVDTFKSINLKCKSKRALKLQKDYEEIKPGYHMNKKYWNTVALNGRVDSSLLNELIDHSYEQVIVALPLKLSNALNA